MKTHTHTHHPHTYIIPYTHAMHHMVYSKLTTEHVTFSRDKQNIPHAFEEFFFLEISSCIHLNTPESTILYVLIYFTPFVFPSYPPTIPSAYQTENEKLPLPVILIDCYCSPTPTKSIKCITDFNGVLDYGACVCVLLLCIECASVYTYMGPSVCRPEIKI